MTKLTIIDFNRTVYDPERKMLIEGIMEVLTILRDRGFILYLISKKEKGREHILASLGIEHFFSRIEFVEEKTRDLFEAILRVSGIPKNDVYIVGDYLYEEIRAGNQCGVKTIWFKSGRFAGQQQKTKDDKPWKTITRMSDLPEAIGL